MERTGYLVAHDGTRLFYREWLPDRPRAIASLVHGLGEHSGRYADLAGHLNAQGIALRAHDHRGHGRSDGARGTLERESDLVCDLQRVFDDFARQQGQQPFLIGHSLGGLVAAQFAGQARSPLRGLVLSSPALAIRLSSLQRLLLRATASLAPRLRTGNGLPVDALSHDVSVVNAYRADPLVHSRVTPRLVCAMLQAIGEVPETAGTVGVPVLMLVAGQDRLVDASGSSRYFARLSPGTGTLRWYDDSYHEVFNETPSIRLQALRDLSAWLEPRLLS